MTRPRTGGVYLVDEYAISDPGGLLLLKTSMRRMDRANEAADQLAVDGITTRDKFGQVKPHPAAAIERDAWAGMLAALKMLNLDLEPLHPGPGRPAGGSSGALTVPWRR